MIARQSRPTGWLGRWQVRRRLQGRTRDAQARLLLETRGAQDRLFPSAIPRPTRRWFLGLQISLVIGAGLWALLLWVLGWIG